MHSKNEIDDRSQEESVKSENWVSFETTFMEIIESLYDNRTEIPLKPEIKLQLFLGAYLNISLYRQHKYLKTQGLTKRITAYFNHISPLTTQRLFQHCSTIQQKIFEKTRKTGEFPVIPSRLKKKIKPIFRILEDYKWDTSQDDLRGAFITGYNLFSEIFLSQLSPVVKDDNADEVAKKIEKDDTSRYEYLEKVIVDFTGKSSRFSFSENRSAFIGIMTGVYYFEVAWRQKTFLGTLSLPKLLLGFLRQPNDRFLKRLQSGVHSVIWKLAVNNLRRREKNEGELYGLFLPLNRIQIAIFSSLYLFPIKSPFIQTSLNKETEEKLNSKFLLLGFFIGYAISMKASEDAFLKGKSSEKSTIKREKIEKDPNSENGGKISKEPIFVSEQEYLERLDSLSNLSQWTNQEKILFLYGVFFQRAINLEKQKLSSEKLKKQFTRFFPRMNNVNTHILGSQISYTLLSLWVYEEIHSKSTFFGIFPILRWQLFSLMKKVDDITTRSKLSLAFMQGFDAFNRIMASKNERD